jgi:hypothetical protein
MLKVNARTVLAEVIEPAEGKKIMTRHLLAPLLVALAVNATPISAQEKPQATLYKNPRCICCEWYARYLRANGYIVTVRPTHNLTLIRREHGVPDRLEGCHTTLVEGYVVEGHVPVATINKLLTERPRINGISLPGMPSGSPGMTGRKTKPFVIFELLEGQSKVFATE